MAQNNLAVVRQAWDAFARGDWEALLALYDADVLWDMTNFRDWPESTYHGHEEVRHFLSEWLAIWDDYEVSPDETITAPDGRVIVLGRQRGKGRGSGLPMEMEWAQVNTVRAGKLVHIDNYDDRQRALEAVGLKRGNLGRALQAYDTFNRRDLDAFLALTHEEIVNDSRIAAIEGGYYGLEGTQRWWNDFLQALPDYTIELIGLRELGDATIGQARALAHGAGSSAPLVDTIWHVIRWRDGKVIWWHPFPTEAEAVEAAQSGG